MFNSTTIDVAIGLVFVFLLLSLTASAAKELLEALAKRRAKDLKRGINELLGTGSDAFVEALYKHGLINSLFQGGYDSNKPGKLPSYIPSKNFALALMDLRNQIIARDKTKDGNQIIAEDETIPPGILPLHVRQAFRAFETTAGQDAAKLQQQVEEWYNSSMDRVSGWYKRRSQWWVFGIGLVISIAVNADCIVIAKRLSTDASLRQAVIRAAEQEVKDNPAPQAAAPTKGDTVEQSVGKIKVHLSELDGVGLPVGWHNDQQKTLAGVFAHFPGWFLTALAVSLGAPFWFDMLNKIMVVRSTVKPHEKSKEEGSKDPGTPKTGTPSTQKKDSV